MSYTFSTPLDPMPEPRALLDGLGHDDLRVEEDADRAAPWPGGYLHAYRWGVSTRGVELYAEDGELAVRLLTGSSPEDHRLALALVRRGAELGGTGLVTPEETGEPVPLDALGGRWGDAWIADQVVGQVTALERLVDEQDTVATLRGPVRDFYLGPRLLGELRAAGGEDGLAGRLFAAIRRVQYVDDGVYAASVLGVRDGARLVHAAVLGPDVRTLLPRVDRVYLHGGEADLWVALDQVPGLVGEERAAWLDERHLLVEAVPEGEWTGVLERAAAVGRS